MLDQQPSELRDFLLKTAFMEEFNAELCQELLGPPPADGAWQAMMETILAQNLFVLAVEKDGFWLRYHHLFCDFLQDRLRLEDPQQAYQLQQSLIDIYARREQWQKAYAICLNLGDLEITGDFLEHAGEPMVRSGQRGIAQEAGWKHYPPVSLPNGQPCLPGWGSGCRCKAIRNAA